MLFLFKLHGHQILVVFVDEGTPFAFVFIFVFEVVLVEKLLPLPVFFLLKVVYEISFRLEVFFEDGFEVVAALLKVGDLVHVEVNAAEDLANEGFEVARITGVLHILAALTGS